MVIDNFEHLIAAAMLIAELLALAPGVRVIISSRTALRIRGEQTFAVEPLELPGRRLRSGGRESPAVQMFLQRATEANRKLEVDPDVVRTVARSAARSTACRWRSSSPLALSFVQPRRRSPSRWREPLLIGEHAMRDLPPASRRSRRRSGGATTCSPRARSEVLRSAAVFLGGFTLPALEAVADGPVGAGDRRAARGQPRPASVRRRPLRAARARARVRAATSSRLARTSRRRQLRHRRYFAAHVAPAGEAFDDGGAPGELAAPLLADHANLRAAFEDAIDDRRRGIGGRAGARAATGMDRRDLPPGELRSSPIACSTASRYPASRRSPCYERWHIWITDRPRPTGIVGSPRWRPRSVIKRR